MNHGVKVVLSALVFGVVAGSIMVGMNVATQRQTAVEATTELSSASEEIKSLGQDAASGKESQPGASEKESGGGGSGAAAEGNESDKAGKTEDKETKSAAKEDKDNKDNKTDGNSKSETENDKAEDNNRSSFGIIDNDSYGNDGGKTVSEVAKLAMPSVVAITNMIRYQQNGFSIFGSYQSEETEIPASGSGVIVDMTDDELLIVTNNHVVADSSSLSVTFMDEETVDAKIKGTDASADLAIVAVELDDIPSKTMNSIKVIKIGDSDKLSVGDQVVAIGNALGYGQSVTTGIISAKDRDVETMEGTESGLLQTDAAINPGNSGGALLNMDGELIGINVAKYSDMDVEGMGYSIPSSKAKDVINNLSMLATREEVPEEERGYLGVQVKNIDKATSQSFDMPQGVFIYKFTEDSSAENSGLHEKDIIVKLDGQGVTNYNELQTLLSRYKAGEEVVVSVMRQDSDGKYVEVEVKVVLGSYPLEDGSGKKNNDKDDSDGSSGNGRSDDPFRRPEENDGGRSGQDNDGDDYWNGDYMDPSMEEFWREFEQYFQDYNNMR